MITSKGSDAPRATSVHVSDDELVVGLADGRSITVPLSWYPRLLHATPAHRAMWELLGDGEGIRWPEIDEDLSVAGLLEGRPAPNAQPPSTAH